MHLMRQKQKGTAMSLWVSLDPSQGTGSFGILYRFSINAIEWGVPEHSLITFSALILKRNQQIDLYGVSWEALRTEARRLWDYPSLGSLKCVCLSKPEESDVPLLSSCPSCLSNETDDTKNPPLKPLEMPLKWGKIKMRFKKNKTKKKSERAEAQTEKWTRPVFCWWSLVILSLITGQPQQGEKWRGGLQTLPGGRWKQSPAGFRWMMFGLSCSPQKFMAGFCENTDDHSAWNTAK